MLAAPRVPCRLAGPAFQTARNTRSGRSHLALPAHTDAADAWRVLRAELRRRIGASAFDIWLAGLEVASYDGQTMVVSGRAETELWVSRRYGRLLGQAAEDVLGPGVRLSFAGGEKAVEPSAGPAPGAQEFRTGFNPRYRFEQFIIGESNRLAHAAALAVAENPGQAYNPLFLYAPPGLGKTHLLHAIGNYVLSFGAGATVRYTTAESFTNHFVTALSTRSIEAFKRAYRTTDVLLIDDVQFLAEKAKTEEEFFHTFNALYDTGRQLVLTCDRLPRALTGIEQRLRERFEAGLVADIRPPDHATRVAILRKRAALDDIEIADPAVLALIAERVDRQHPRPRRGADPGRRLPLAHPAPDRPAAHHRGARHHVPGDGRARAPSRRRALDRRRAGDRRRPLRPDRRAAHLRQPRGRRHLAAADRAPSRARPHGPVPAGDRPGLRGPQPRHRPARLQAGLAAPQGRPAGPTGC